MLRQILTLVGLAVASTAVHAQGAAPTKRCRPPSANYNLEDAGLPVCTSNYSRPSAAIRAPSSYGTQSLVVTRPATSRGPASIPASNLTFEQYMSANAANPAMHTEIKDHQRAFVDNNPAAVITMPESLVSSDASSATPATAPATTPSPSLAGSGTSSATTPPPSPTR